MRKVIKVVAGFLVCLALLGIRAGSVWATGEQSVKELIGRDGEYLATSWIAQEFTGEVEVSGNVALLWNVSKVSFFERDASGFWNIKQEMEGYRQYQFSHMTLSENTAIVNAESETENGGYGALYVFSRNQDGIWRQPQKIEGYISYISGNIMVVGQRYYYAPSFSMKVYERDANNTWQEKQTISFKNEDASTIEKDLTTYYPGAIWNNCLIITSGQYGAFIFERDASGVWKFSKRLTDPDGQNDSYRGFGSSVLISGNDVFFPSDQGTFLFERKPDGNWQQKSRFPGYWLQISGNYALTEEDNALSIFERDQNGTWRRKQELTAEIGRGDQYHGIALKDNYAGFVSYRYSDYLSTNYVFERNPEGIWQLRFKTNPWDDNFAEGNLSFYNDGVVCSTHTANLYRLKLTDQFVIPNDKKYLVFKVERNASIRSLDAVTDKINFEAVGIKSDPDEPDKVAEVAYRLLLNKTRYMEGADAFYYIIDLSTLREKYIETCQNKFQLENPGAGYQIYQKVGLRLRYDSPVAGSNLKDVYVTDGGRIINVKADVGGASVSWTEIDADDAAKIIGYQVDYTETPDPPQKGINDLPVLKVPYETKSDLSARKVYYVWVRPIDIQGIAGPWTMQQFSPKPKVSAFVATECTSTATTSGRQPQYEIKLKVKDVDVAQYIIQRQEYNKPETLITVNTLSDQVMNANNFLCSGGSGLIKHGKYEYFITTKNASGEPSERSTPIVMNVQNLPPRECIVMKGWREIEVNDQLSLKLGLKADLEGDPLTYRLYIRTPGATDAKRIAAWDPETDYLNVKVPYTFTDKTSYEWQVRCIERDNPYGSGEYANKDWFTTKIDTDALIIIATNDTDKSRSVESFWSTKKQPVKFEIEANPNKTFREYRWIFGDGSNATGLPATHAYANLTPIIPYEVRVTALDEAGIQHNGIMNINIINTYKGKLYDNEEWSGTPVIESEVVVPAGLSLTLMPGTKLQMQARSSLRIYGTLNAQDVTGGITITRQKEDLWKGIIFEGSGSGSLHGLTISYADIGITAAADTGIISLNEVKLVGNRTGLDFFTGTLTANNCLFQSNTAYGVLVEDEIYPAFTKCIFSGNKQHYVDLYGALIEDDVNQYPGGGGNVFLD